MSILKYFNHTPVIVQDQGLPEPISSLSNFVPPKAIELVNTEVEEERTMCGINIAVFTHLSCGVNITLSRIFLLGEFHNSPNFLHLENFTIYQIFFHQCVHAIATNLPNFSSAKVSLHTVFSWMKRISKNIVTSNKIVTL